jgi:hypothetical protein
MKLRAICTAAAGLAFLGCASEAVAQAKPEAPKQVKPEAAKPAPAKAKEITKADVKRFVKQYKADLCIDDKDCKIIITVGRNCTLSFNPYILGIPQVFKDVEIVWKLRSSDDKVKVEFPKTKGVFFKSPSSDGQFSPPRYVNATTYVSKDTNSAFGDHAYGVNAIQDGKVCPTYDPSIINGAP